MPIIIETDVSAVAVEIRLAGRVQGVGLRPAVARLARALSLAGRVMNTSQGVTIHIEGAPDRVHEFEKRLVDRISAETSLERFERTNADVENLDDFQIVKTQSENTVVSARIPPDVVVCPECLEEVESDTHRRAGYPFTSCTSCGPRYSIIDRMPYERSLTAMNRFMLCSQCDSEYASPDDRRFHAQTNACPTCGPHVICRDAEGRELSSRNAAIATAVTAIRRGEIVALQGLGGYQLIVDATSTAAVDRLRGLKDRRGKPFAVMVASLSVAEMLAELSDCERCTLRSAAGPIVIVKHKASTHLASGIAPGLNSIGIMLPTTPLHALLLRASGVPLVVTSGNREGESLIFQHIAARKSLAGIADIWLEHDRPIVRPVDDGVVRVIADRAVTIRLSRGLAPLPLDLSGRESTLSLGGHHKSAFALCNGLQSILGPHIGDLDSLANRQRFLDQLYELERLYGMKAKRFVVDRHPDYWTTRWAYEQPIPVVAVQHHHAHVVAGMLEHRWLDRSVLGIAFDGTGFGDDDTIWGGEFLVATSTSYQRVGHLRPFRLPGGEQAVREPCRIAVSLVEQASGPQTAARLPFDRYDPRTVMPVLHSCRFSPVTSSAGRLFDGIAALVLGIERVDFDGQAAMMLEAACDFGDGESYRIDITDGKPAQLDWRPLVRGILHDRKSDVPAGAIAMRFHRGLAQAIAKFCHRYSQLPVVLGGGVFQNRILVELIIEYMQRTQQEIGRPGIIPPNDGGLASGQLAIALSMDK